MLRDRVNNSVSQVSEIIKEEQPRQNMLKPLLRPPGAINERDFLKGCTRCDACIIACPHDALVAARKKFQEAARTPVLNLVISPCRMCKDTPCITACEPGVLKSTIPFKMGTAQIETLDCFAYKSSFCSVCFFRFSENFTLNVSKTEPVICSSPPTGGS